jgi:thiamine-phosphate pyrophosphorylase
MRQGFTLDLYLVTDRLLCAPLGIEHVVAEAVAGGVTMVQLRDDETPTEDLVAVAGRLKAMLAPVSVPLIVNNRLDVALAAGADGLHVGQGDMPATVARSRLGGRAILGLSITEPGQLAALDPAVVDYLGVGPIFATATKRDAAPAIGLAGLATVRGGTHLRLVAIGGIDLVNTEATIRAGAEGVAVVSAICASADPRTAARALANAVRAGRG